MELKSFYKSNDLIRDYLDGKVTEFHGKSFSKNNLLDIAENKSFPVSDRGVLVQQLEKQYEDIECSEATISNIKALKEEHVFTVTTGHQLNIFTGPLFFVYKILQVINITEELNKDQDKLRFVPVFWMASEDHDFDEIASFNVGDSKLAWKKNTQNAVGRINLEGLELVQEELKRHLGVGNEEILNLCDQYCQQNTLAQATLFIANKLFAKYGLVILDADNQKLKARFSKTMRRELLNSEAHLEIHDTISRFDKKGYKVQVNPREINLFYLNNKVRGRIVKENNIYKVTNTSLQFSESEILDLLKEHPERFSPNVVMRPMYQETILPNIAYLGGAGEMAYWLELKSAFEKYEIPFPVLIVRNSMLLIDPKTKKKLKRLQLKPKDFLKDKDLLIKEYIKEHNKELEMQEEGDLLKELKARFLQKANRVDKSLEAAVEASLKRHEKELKKLDSKFVKVLKQKHKHDVEAIQFVKSQFFPSGNLQERHQNILPYLINFGFEFIEFLKKNIGAFDQKLEFVDLEDYGNHS